MIWPLILYNAVNVYTDMRWRKTKNAWHLLYFLASFVLLQMVGPPFWSIEMLQFLGIAVVLWLLAGLFFESFRFFSPGDTKMLVVNAFWVSLLSYQSGQWEGVQETLWLLAFWFILSYLAVSVFLTVRKFGWKAMLRSLCTRVSLRKTDGTLLSFPGAVPIACAVGLTLLVTI